MVKRQSYLPRAEGTSLKMADAIGRQKRLTELKALGERGREGGMG